jgi:hypothetical protein
MLKVNQGLVKLFITDIISLESCVAIAQGLHHNKTLRELELTYASESDKVGEAMVQMLEQNKTLTGLKLYMSYSFETDMSFSAAKGTEYEDVQSDNDWEATVDHYLQMNREGMR